MIIDALRFGSGAPTAGAPVDLVPTSESAFLESLGNVRPDVFVVPLDGLERVRALGGAVIDCGRRDRRVTLWRILRRQPGDALIDGDFEKPGHLLNAVHTVADRALEHGIGHRFIVGAKPPVVSALMERATRASRVSVRGADFVGGVAADAVIGPPAPEVGLMRDLLPHDAAVPPELVERFPGGSTYAEVVRKLIWKAAWTRAGVLLVGEAGACRAEVARHIHTLSQGRPFASLMCATYPCDDGHRLEDQLFRSPLAGGRGDSRGLWEIAKDGTLFIDDVDLLPLRVQACIAAALRARSPMRGRGWAPSPRLIAGTSRDLQLPATEGSFNLELLHHLSVITIPLLPLRQRKEDLPDIAQAMWRELTGEDDAALTSGVVSALQARDWPGNEGELRRVLSTLLTLYGEDGLTSDHVHVDQWLARTSRRKPRDAS